MTKPHSASLGVRWVAAAGGGKERPPCSLAWGGGRGVVCGHVQMVSSLPTRKLWVLTHAMSFGRYLPIDQDDICAWRSPLGKNILPPSWKFQGEKEPWEISWWVFLDAYRIPCTVLDSMKNSKVLKVTGFVICCHLFICLLSWAASSSEER